MPIPAPLTPTVLTSGVLMNIAADILKHHVQAPEGTLATWMLKRIGLIEPSFDDRLCGTLSEALTLCPESRPQYKLTGVTAPFHHNLVAAQQLDAMSCTVIQLTSAKPTRLLFDTSAATVLLEHCSSNAS
jgi:hypothetical protein